MAYEQITENSAQENFRSMSLLIGKIGIPLLRNAPAMGEGPLPSETPVIRVVIHDNYMRLAMQRHHEFVRNMTSPRIQSVYPHKSPEEHRDLSIEARYLVGSDGVKHGFLTCGYLMGYSMKAYRQNRYEAGVEPNTEELTKLLRDNHTTNNIVLKLAVMSPEHNGKWEEAARLNSYAYSTLRHAPYTPLAVTQQDNGELQLNYIEDVHTEAQRRIDRMRLIQTNTSCPAFRYIPLLWRSMVDEAAVNPLLFAADLATST